MTHTTTIYHNPRCGTSRDALQLIIDAGITPTIVLYLTHPPSRPVLAGLIAQAGLTPREAIREKESLFAELGLDDPALTDEQLIDAMIENPVLINRPFVVAPGGTRLCRPASVVLEILHKQ